MHWKCNKTRRLQQNHKSSKKCQVKILHDNPRHTRSFLRCHISTRLWRKVELRHFIIYVPMDIDAMGNRWWRITWRWKGPKHWSSQICHLCGVDGQLHSWWKTLEEAHMTTKWHTPMAKWA
jgi:hypothetical protein